jgi:hypothetical protein
MSTQNNTQESAAAPRFTTAGKRPREIVDSTEKLAEVMKSHPDFATTPGLADAVTAWVGSAQAIDQHEQSIASANAALKAAVANRGKETLTWKRSTKKVLAIIGEITKGSPTAVKEWGFEVATRNPRPPSSDPPSGVRVEYARDLTLVVKWHRVLGHLGYVVQIGDGTAQGWGPAIPCPKSQLTPTGLEPGQHVSIRVAVQRKDGLSAFSDPLALVVR